MTPEAFKEFWTEGLYMRLRTITLTQDQADEVKAFFQSRARDRENVAPTVTRVIPPARAGAQGVGCASSSSSAAPPLNSH